jgi:hypothetical protein
MNIKKWKPKLKSYKSVKPDSYEFQGKKLKASIHHYFGCGDTWFLSCYTLGISASDLKTCEIKEAIEKSMCKMGSVIGQITDDFERLL